ncbi:hypothetical protein [Roseimicrobium gellanilyticum]|uniref:hypothetical protein n=1 Tax=Roseimicrobium gellanilyticum TaxID=748857 RepID=UPI0011BFB315|nr:hypothetical protein [Roseimicrobium gellanilyticum]
MTDFRQSSVKSDAAHDASVRGNFTLPTRPPQRHPRKESTVPIAEDTGKDHIRSLAARQHHGFRQDCLEDFSHCFPGTGFIPLQKQLQSVVTKSGKKLG